MPIRMRLSDYLDSFSWSQAELQRQANVSAQTVARALSGEPIRRSSADAIISALDRKHKAQGLKGAVTLASIRGLRISELRRKKRVSKDKEQGQETAAD